MVEDAGDVGGEEEFAVADAEDGGWAHAGGDELVGLVCGEDADGEGSGDALDGAADGFFEGDCWFFESEDCFGGVGFGGIGAGASKIQGSFAALRMTTSILSTVAFAVCCSGLVELVFDEVGDDFGVGFGDELVTFGDESVLEGEVVFDDAVVDDDESAAAVAV